MSLFRRAALGAALSPAERAWLRLIKSFLITGLIAILPTVAQLVSAVGSGTPITLNWQTQGYYLLLVFVVAVAHAIAKYFSALGDAPVAAIIDTAANDVAQRIPASPTYVTTPPSTLPAPADTPATTAMPITSST